MKQPGKYKLKGFYAIIGIALNFAILFNLFANSFHEQVKHHQHAHEEICSSEFEQDACHRFLVHHEESISCNKEHKHITEKNDDCFICKHFKERKNDLYIESKSLIYIVCGTAINYTVSTAKVKSSNTFYSYLRGPPVHVS